MINETHKDHLLKFGHHLEQLRKRKIYPFGNLLSIVISNMPI
jgi:hypothetical protein